MMISTAVVTCNVFFISWVTVELLQVMSVIWHEHPLQPPNHPAKTKGWSLSLAMDWM